MRSNFLLMLAIIPVVMGEITDWIFKEKVHYGARPDVKIGARVSSHRMHTVDVYMKLRNIDVLHEVLMNVSTPNHPEYGRHWTRDQLHELTGNSEASHQVVKILEDHGASVVQRSKFSEYVTMRAPVAVWEHLFSTKFYEFSHPDWGSKKVFRALDYSLPADLHEHVFHIDHVVHFPPVMNSQPIIVDDFQPPKDHANHVDLNSLKVNGYVTPAFLSDYYNISNNIGDARTSQAIFASLGQYFSPADLSSFQTDLLLPQETIVGDIGEGGHINDTHCVSSPNDCGETNLDVQYIMGIAQNVPTYHAYFNGPMNFIYALENITSMAQPPHVVSISYGGYGFDYYYNYIFNIYAMYAGAMGITIVVASGDDGALNFGVRGNANACHYEPSFPAYTPYVLAVGATQDAEWGGTEVACSSANGGVITSGGGFSPYDSRPIWQNTSISTYFDTVNSLGLSPAPGYYANNRGYPDISLVGTKYLVKIGGSFFPTYGTSASAPAIGGMISLLNSVMVARGYSTLGFINPTLYDFGNFFIRDILEGKNNCTVGLTCCAEGFSASAGWDPVTGLGVPMFDKWLYLLNNGTSNSSYPVYNYTEPTAVPTWQVYYNQSQPSELPTHFNLSYPTEIPSMVPYNNLSYPTEIPSIVPYYNQSYPSMVPYLNQSQPSELPTEFPTFYPTEVPTYIATDTPTVAPSTTSRPSTRAPSAVPTRLPTVVPTRIPTKTPTIVPTASPTFTVTARPSVTPTLRPSALPTIVPTARPSATPSIVPTKIPTITPTARPSTIAPTAPTRTPTERPSRIPTREPTAIPTKIPTIVPTKIPTRTPTFIPTKLPTNSPTKVPTKVPTVIPTRIPTATPTRFPTKAPTVVPTKIPTRQPTFVPTKTPTIVPTKIPTREPTIRPSKTPTVVPTKIPTREPTFHPTKAPTNAPTRFPTREPTVHPTRMPTAQPTVRPTTSAPTHSLNEVGQVTCASYSASNTLSATRNYASCRIMACNNYVVKANMCSEQTVGQATCNGDTFLRVFNSAGVQIASNDNYCGRCSGLTFTATSQCEMYTIREGCAGNLICSGSVVVSYYIPEATSIPTNFPTFSPTNMTFSPTFMPTQEPTDPQR